MNGRIKLYLLLILPFILSLAPTLPLSSHNQVVVYTALLDMLSSEDELAAVLAHETAHVLARHHVGHMCLPDTV